MKKGYPCNGWSFVLILSLGIFACNLPAPTDSPSPFPPVPTHPPTQETIFPIPSEPSLTPTTATITYQPTFEPAPCAFPVPRGYSPECGYLIVPENRARPDTQLISLHIGIFRNESGYANLDPVIKLSGGPNLFGEGLFLRLVERVFRNALNLAQTGLPYILKVLEI